MVLGTGLLTVLLIYLATRQGRLERGSTDIPGKRPLHHYAGVVSSDSNPVPVFIWVVIVIVALWAIAYNVNVAIHGLGY
jgi:hypothetical protein